MKLDNEQMRGHSTLLFKPVCKSLINPLKMEELKLEKEILTEDQHRMTSGIKSQNCEKVDPLVTEDNSDDRVGNKPKLLNFVDRDDIINRRGNKMEDCEILCTIPSTEVELSEKGECYTDKSVMDCEVPEQIACFKVDACHVVKDICVDEEVPFLDKVLIELGEVDLKRRFQPSYLNFTDASRKSVDSPSLISDGMKSVVGHYHNMDISGQCGSQNLTHESDENIHPEDDITHNEMNSVDEHIHDENVSIQYCSKNQLQKGEANIDAKDEIPHCIPDKRVVPENLLLFHNWEKENCHLDSYPFKSDKGQQHSEQEQLCSVENLLHKNEGKIDENEDITKGVSDDVLPLNVPLLQKPGIENSRPASSNFNGNEDEQQSDQDTSNELITSYSVVCFAAGQPSNSNRVDRPPFDSKVERGSITFNFDSPITSSKEESPYNANDQRLQPLPGGLEDGTVDSLTTSSRSFFIQDGHGESSFSAVGRVSGPISYSGPISHSGPVPYSGSISLRSDSSTTSTRSFAFPVLHAESNGSPAKMAKADRRRFQKHRGWRQKLLCCRF
ncbi:uncharacterized protein LOC122652249 [Telopea speciosissima]|uniref:uncharacterized protein LOC122652249 n=1 Tax=Telopea speciosissima TaxID=54955 RepID=UPI001CC34607|nr:uncharacterized protein LOC122652249 [Telopea speciosissima]XP_043701873.1 uncharacterized protein LOC122652249 [Telopea speciosissima]XP_043701874.1 uncharacterized protein LOC122652249 [Telopea speciosissima]